MSRLQNRTLALYLFLAFCSFLLPYHVRPVSNFYHDALAIIALIVGIGLLSISSKVEIRLPSVALLPVALIIVIALQTQNGYMLLPTDGFFPIVELLAFALAAIYGATLVATEHDLEGLCLRFAWMFMLVGLVSVVFQHIQLAVVDVPFVMAAGSKHEVFRPYANVGQPNVLALLYCFSLASVWWLYSQKKMRVRIAIGIVVILLWGLALTQSRIAWIILPAFTVMCWFPPVDSAPVRRRVLVIFCALFVAMICAVPGVIEMTGLKVESVAQRAGQTSERIVLWQEAWAMSTLHPWFGVGWSQFGANQAQLAVLFKPATVSNHAHNIVLNFAAEIGWPITLLIVVCSTYWFRKCCISKWANPQIRFICLIFVAIMIHSMLEFPMWYAILLLPFGVLVGAVHRPELGLRQIVMAREWIILFFILAMAAFTFVFWDFQRVAATYKVAVEQETATVKDSNYLNKPQVTLFAQHYDFLRVAQIRIFPGMPVQDIAFLEKMSLNFGFPPVFGRLALAYAENNRPREALQVLLTNQRLNEQYYPNSYRWWAALSKENPALFGEIFRRLPVPAVDTQVNDEAKVAE